MVHGSFSGHHMFDLSALPDNLYGPEVPTSAWTNRIETSSGHKFPSGSLGKLSPVPWKAQLERLIGIPIYLMLNWLPFLLPLVCFAVGGARGLAILAAVLASLTLRPVYTLLGSMLSCIPLALGVPKAQLSGQYVYTERNNQKYLSMRMVWGEAFERYRTTKAGEGRPVIFAIIPMASRRRHRLPGVVEALWWRVPVDRRACGAQDSTRRPMLRSIGYVEAKGKAISGALSSDSVGIVLGGIAGMFNQSDSIEKGYVLQRKAIAALALRELRHRPRLAGHIALDGRHGSLRPARASLDRSQRECLPVLRPVGLAAWGTSQAAGSRRCRDRLSVGAHHPLLPTPLLPRQVAKCTHASWRASRRLR